MYGIRALRSAEEAVDEAELFGVDAHHLLCGEAVCPVGAVGAGGIHSGVLAEYHNVLYG